MSSIEPTSGQHGQEAPLLLGRVVDDEDDEEERRMPELDLSQSLQRRLSLSGMKNMSVR